MCPTDVFRIINWTLAADLKVSHVIPTEGNEAVIGVDYKYRPEFMAAIKRAIQSRDTVITSTITLLQTGRPGIIIRSPIFSEDGNYLGMVSATMDLEVLLETAGYRSEQGYEPLIEARSSHRASQMVRGTFQSFARLPEGPRLALPENVSWEVRAKPLPVATPPLLERSELIRLLGAILSTLLLVFLLWRARLLPAFNLSRQGISLQLAIHGVTFAPLLLLFLLVEAFYFDTLRRSSEQQLESLASALMRQAQLQAKAFFEVPKQAISIVELFRQGILTTRQPCEMLSFFAAQMRVQPQLTFLSIGNQVGEYYAVSRPPTGADRSLRMQWATLKTGREMRIHWAADDNQPSELFLHGAKYFDARDKVWYQNALKSGKNQWYPVYRYTTSDERKQYDALGIGIAAPIYTDDKSLLGVMTADVAMSQISDLLKYQTQDSGTTLYMTELDGKLVALSTDDPAYLMDANNTARRLLTSESDNPLIRLTGATVLASDQPRGQQLFEFDEQKYLLNWERIEIPDGPTFNLILAITSKQATSAMRQLWSRSLYLGWLLLMFSIILVLFATRRITIPLHDLERWANRLGLGELKSPVPPPGPILEVASLNKTMGGMAGQINEYTEKLEHLVHERTEALSTANAELERLSKTDGLTGLANRRHLDESAAAFLLHTRRNRQDLALLLMDVDHFKAYNDHYGHLAGDEALKTLAQILKDRARRSTDIAARYGGEEFALVLCDTSLEDALKIGEDILSQLTEMNVPHQKSPIGRLSFSIGIALAPGDRDYRLELLYKQADQALYRAKSEGRNRVVVFQG